MARVTIEDCLQHVPNRFDLVILASKRARQLIAGAEPLVPVNNDKVTVLALREIASGLLDLKSLAKNDLVRHKKVEVEEAIIHASSNEARDLMAEEIHVPGVDESKSDSAFNDDEDLDALMATGSATPSPTFSANDMESVPAEEHETPLPENHDTL